MVDRIDANVSISRLIKSTDGRSYPADKVFIQALQYIKNKVMTQILSLNLGVETTDDIQWVLTVPAIWDDLSKDLMKQWCVKAGLINKQISNHLKIVYEPECASISVRHDISNAHEKIIKQHNNNNDSKENDASLLAKNINDQFKHGQRYILVDAGGGTCDIACHEIVGDYSVKQCYYPTGGKWGSTYIDEAFIWNLLSSVFGKNIIKLFKREYPEKYVDLLVNFRLVKERLLKYEYQSFVEYCRKLEIDEKYDKIDFIHLMCYDNDIDNSEYKIFNEYFKQYNISKQCQIELPLEFVLFIEDHWNDNNIKK